MRYWVALWAVVCFKLKKPERVIELFEQALLVFGYIFIWSSSMANDQLYIILLYLEVSSGTHHEI